MKNFGRKKLPRIEEPGASYDADGVFVSSDWRYELLIDYLQLSSSYQAISKSQKKTIHNPSLPSDVDVVQSVFNDFGDIRQISEARWWDMRGKDLFGIKAPEPQVRELGRLATNNRTLKADWVGFDELVVALPLGLTRSAALKRLSKQIAEIPFAEALPTNIKPKYRLFPSKLRKETLVAGIEALKMYRYNVPLWLIGNRLRVVPAQCFDEQEEKLNPRNYTENKIVLSIAARRLIRCAILVAENAARGRFPSNKTFPEAMLDQYQRKAGRPVGSRGPKRMKAG